MTTLRQTTNNEILANAMKHAEKPTLSSIILMYVWAYKSKPASDATYVGILEAVFEYIDNTRWVALSPQEVFSAWLIQSQEITSSGFTKYQENMNFHLNQVVQD